MKKENNFYNTEKSRFLNQKNFTGEGERHTGKQTHVEKYLKKINKKCKNKRSVSDEWIDCHQHLQMTLFLYKIVTDTIPSMNLSIQ